MASVSTASKLGHVGKIGKALKVPVFVESEESFDARIERQKRYPNDFNGNGLVIVDGVAVFKVKHSELNLPTYRKGPIKFYGNVYEHCTLKEVGRNKPYAIVEPKFSSAATIRKDGFLITRPTRGGQYTVTVNNPVSTTIQGVVFPSSVIFRNVNVGYCTVIGQDVTIYEGSWIGEASVIGMHTRIHADVRIEDDVTIGSNCRIYAGASIGNSCVIGDNVSIAAHSSIATLCRIGEGVEIMFATQIPEGTVLEQDAFYMSVGPLGSRDDYLFAYVAPVAVNVDKSEKQYMLLWHAGCQHNISTSRLLARLNDQHRKGSTYHTEYMQAIKYILGQPYFKSYVSTERFKRPFDLDVKGIGLEHAQDLLSMGAHLEQYPGYKHKRLLSARQKKKVKKPTKE